MLSLLQLLNRFVWNGPMLLLLGITHIFFTYRLRFVQRQVGTGIKWSMTETTFSLWKLRPYWVSLAIAILIGMVLMGGATAIYKVCEKLVPAMAVFYIGSCLLLLWYNHAYLPKAFMLIFENAFSPQAFSSGIAGDGFMFAARYGIASLDFVWETADLLNAFMVIPNLIALFVLQRYLPKGSK